jgi:hypothetical protein
VPLALQTVLVQNHAVHILRYRQIAKQTTFVQCVHSLQIVSHESVRGGVSPYSRCRAACSLIRSPQLSMEAPRRSKAASEETALLLSFLLGASFGVGVDRRHPLNPVFGYPEMPVRVLA